MRLRSILFVPGNSERKLRRALGEPADAIVADLEDAVPAAEKEEARAIVAAVFAGTAPGGPARFVRVNGAGSGLLEADLSALAGVALDGIVVPKAEPEDGLPPLPHAVVPIVETAAGAAGARGLARSPGVLALMLGAIDLALELRLRPRRDGAELAFFRSTLVLESALAGIAAPLDGVHVDVRDLEGLEEQARLARSFGMGGKACIHPAQVAVVNAVFAPGSEELEHARRVVAAYSAAVASGSGALALDGRMIDRPVYEQARRLLADEGLSGPEGG
jgi:citrate lyase subunit beta/citryl-CoA lyase